MISIDQNCHSLWDVLPKLQALAFRGHEVTHFVEDIDVAFTATGAGPGSSGLRLAREQYHRGGIADWGAALFYSQFLGRLPVDIANWEPYTGMKTSALARRLDCDVEDLYGEFSVSDNWQLIGPSYVGDTEHHRVIGDLTVAETAGVLREILAKARADCLEAFPAPESRRRTAEWFDAEQALVGQLLEECSAGRLVDVYGKWLGTHLPGGVDLKMTSSLFANHADPGRTALLEVFLADYDRASGLYNEAVEEANLGLRPLDTGSGELPFFATMNYQGHVVRCAARLDGRGIRVGNLSYNLLPGNKLPLDKMSADGVFALAGKAILLVIQARIGSAGRELALPYRGSQYVPAAHLLAEKLRSARMLPGQLRPIVRVRFRLLDRMMDVGTVLRLPEHLRWYFSADQAPACELARNHTELARQARARLESFRDQAGRSLWQRQAFPRIAEEVDALDRRRRELAAKDPKAPDIRELGKQQKRLELRLLRELLVRICHDVQSAEIDYWDSRGALLPWCVALGGRELYNSVISRAELYREDGAG